MDRKSKIREREREGKRRRKKERCPVACESELLAGEG